MPWLSLCALGISKNSCFTLPFQEGQVEWEPKISVVRARRTIILELSFFPVGTCSSGLIFSVFSILSALSDTSGHIRLMQSQTLSENIGGETIHWELERSWAMRKVGLICFPLFRFSLLVHHERLCWGAQRLFTVLSAVRRGGGTTNKQTKTSHMK